MKGGPVKGYGDTKDIGEKKNTTGENREGNIAINR